MAVANELLLNSVRVRRPASAGAPLYCDALEYGLTGDGATNDQPALNPAAQAARNAVRE